MHVPDDRACPAAHAVAVQVLLPLYSFHPVRAVEFGTSDALQSRQQPLMLVSLE